MAAVQGADNTDYDNVQANYDPGSSKNSCPGRKTLDDIENDLVKLFHDGLDNGLRVLGNEDVILKEQQYEALLAVTIHKRDCLVVLPTGFGKSLVYQLLPVVFDYTLSLNTTKLMGSGSSIIVVSPLNGLIRDQVSKLQNYISVGIVKNKYDTSDSHETALSHDLEEVIENMPRIVFAHPESLVGDKRALRLLKSKKCQDCVSAIVVDEAHLVINW